MVRRSISRARLCEECGEPLDQAFVCWHCDTTIRPGEIRSRHLEETHR